MRFDILGNTILSVFLFILIFCAIFIIGAIALEALKTVITSFYNQVLRLILENMK